MLAPQCYVHFKRWPRSSNDVPLLRWSTAPLLRALASLLRARADIYRTVFGAAATTSIQESTT